MLFSISQNFSLKLQQMVPWCCFRKTTCSQMWKCKLISKLLSKDLYKQQLVKRSIERWTHGCAKQVVVCNSSAQIVVKCPNYIWRAQDSHGTLKHGAGWVLSPCTKNRNSMLCLPKFKLSSFERNKSRQGGTRTSSNEKEISQVGRCPLMPIQLLFFYEGTE